ncbi:di-heme oxidoredictase family protein [Paraglaciecola sp.]|uniref:di-heme oxidoredictase family protein n=1 Tax=Paraglaciecola sp. TaxID=1920173 RepID=UPI0030F3FAF2
MYATQRQSEVTVNGQGQPDGLSHKGWYTEINGEVVWSTAPYDEKFHLIINFAVGGTWSENVNLGGVDPSAFHQNNSFEVDYIRVYECSISPANGQGCATITPGYDELIQNGGTLQQGKAPTPVPPSDGIARELVIFADEMHESWPAWDCCGGLTPAVVLDDGAHGSVVEFVIGNTPTVVGFNTNVSSLPKAYDGSPLSSNGVLEFDLKLVTAPTNASAQWNLKVEQAGASTEAVVTINTPSSEWQHYVIPLRNLAGGGLNLNGIDVVMIFPDWGQGEGAVFRVDNVAFVEGEVTPPGHGLDKHVLVDFEQAQASYGFNNFDGGVSTVIANPHNVSANSSAQVVQMQKFAVQSWGGTTFNLAAPIDVDNSLFSMKVWSDRPVNVLFKLEGMSVERNVAHSGSGWEELTFDFNGAVGTAVSKITVIFDLGTMGNAAGNPANWTFFYDDVAIYVEPQNEVMDFEQAANSYAFNNFDGGISTVIANPHSSGINTSAQVVQMQKFAAQTWGGSTLDLDVPVDVDSTVFKMKVWSSRAVNVLFKLEGMNVERSVVHSGSGWEELSFDFAGAVGTNVSKITIIFDLGVMGDANNNPQNWTFYYDDITYPKADEEVVAPPPPSGFKVDFEAAPASYVFANFDGGVSTVIVNPHNGAGNNSAQVVKMQKYAGQHWGGSTLNLASAITVDSSVFSLNVWSDRAVNVLFKLEGMNVERSVSHSGSGWQELNFDFTGETGSGVNQITLIFDLGTLGNADSDPANWTFYYDDMGFATDEDVDPSTLLVDFEATPASYTFANFDGGVATVIANPQSSAGNNSGQMAQMQKYAGQHWGGSTLNLDAVVDVDSSIFSMKVWSGRAVNVLFKLEGVNQERNVAHSGTGWEVLSFDFNGVAGSVSQATIIFDLGIVGDAAGNAANWTFYFDDIRHSSLSVATDTDGDGVFDGDDLCPNTPPGTAVDANGCTLVVSADADGDGVPDSEDLCPNTPAGAPVNAVGCAIATGITGIEQFSANAVAFFVNTTGWADVHYQINGAGQQNLRMQNAGSRNTYTVGNLTSGDLISYNFTYLQANGVVTDSARATYTVGNDLSEDSDGDGVGDAFDQCPNTPVGDEVDVNGCTIIGDSDGDGVRDDVDQCPNTAPGTEVDAHGCALVPINDADNDGVADELDQCPATPPNTLVDAVGCPIVQAVNEVASINDILVGGFGSPHPGFALYVFDNDLPIVDGSICNDGCATNWPPVLVADGVASGVADLSVITRDDGSIQATYDGRPLYFYSNDLAAGDTNGDGLGGVWHLVAYSVNIGDITPLYNSSTTLEQPISFDRGDALVTRFADRGRDRHAKEDQFQIYDHYLSHYWTHRTAQFEFVDYVAKGGSTIEVNFITEWRLSAREFRAWYRGLGTVAEYHGNYFGGGAVVEVDNGSYDFNFNKISDAGDQYRYRVVIGDYRPLNWDPAGGVLPLQVGQRMEVEVSQFLDAPPEGRENYYGTTYLYVVGQGMVPWKTVGNFNDPSSEREDSYPIDKAAWLGGKTTLPYNYTNEPDNHFMQMATNLSNVNGQAFVQGRRVHHSSFVDGQHDEHGGENGVFNDVLGKAGTHYVNESCAGCHVRNGRAAPVAIGQPLDKWVFKVGDITGEPDANIGRILQPKNVGIDNNTQGEGSVSIASWTENNGLRSPNYQFSKGAPAQFSARIAPQLVGLGLLEAIPESAIIAMEDSNDLNGDGISGRAQRTLDPQTGETRLGRFGYKAAAFSIKHQVATALNNDMGVMNSVLPSPDCGSAQATCGASGTEVSDQYLDELSKYISLLGVRAQRDVDSVQVQQGKTLFSNIGCVGCHTDTLQTSEFHPLSELRSQTIHPYTDLLLHDMGAGLADTLGEGQASGAEWRTTPLWGIGLSACVTGGVTNPIGGQGNEVCTPEHSYLHDGRARTIEEAVLWHGGESESSRVAFESLNSGDKAAVLAFLNSL